MILDIRVIPKSSRNLVKQEPDILWCRKAQNTFLTTENRRRSSPKAIFLKVYVTDALQNNLANDRVIDLLAEYFKVKKYQIRLIRGLHSRNKVVEIIDGDLPSKK